MIASIWILSLSNPTQDEVMTFIFGLQLSCGTILLDLDIDKNKNSELQPYTKPKFKLYQDKFGLKT